MKITVVGAGAVGGSCLEHIARLKLADSIVLIDVKEGLAEGKVIDLEQSYTLEPGMKTSILGVTKNYEATANSDITVITSGIPRKPGMTREELVATNAAIVKSVAEECLKVSPETIFIIVSNPMDTLTYLAVKSLGIAKNRIIGMGGVLDSSRFRYYISKHLDKDPSTIDCMVIGGHGDTTMVPLASKARVEKKLLSELTDSATIESIVSSTMTGGATITKLVGTSAWVAPGASVAHLAGQIMKDSRVVLPCSVYLEGEYGYSDICIGMPVILSRKGWARVEVMDLNEHEAEALAQSVEKVRLVNSQLKL